LKHKHLFLRGWSRECFIEIYINNQCKIVFYDTGKSQVNCDIDFLSFDNDFTLWVWNFLKFNGVQNSVIKFWTVRKREQEITKLNEMGQNYSSLSPDIVQVY
jgi:hypothetical protein